MENRCTALSVKEELTVAVGFAFPMLTSTPLLIVHGRGDQAVPPEDAQAAYDSASEPKDIVWLQTANHIDLYDDEALVEAAVDAAASWFSRHPR